MKPYLRKRARNEKRSRMTGIIAAAAIHAFAGFFLATSGMTYLDPPPPEQSFLVDFTVEEPVETVAEEVVSGQSEEVVDTAPKPTPETPPDTFGDVEAPTPPEEEPKLDPRAAFPGMSKKEDTATAPSSSPDSAVKEGLASGSPKASLKGRSIVGAIPSPNYPIQTEGIVVVTIMVDQYGNVTEAVPGAEGTTITDRNLWNAARNAAMKAHFNQSAEAPVLQQGTITYKFKLQ